VRPPDDLGVIVEETLTVIDQLFEDGEESADRAALVCPTLSPETLTMVGDYLRDCLTGAIPPSLVANEARTWLEVGLTGWPFESPTALTLLRALRMLASLTPEGADADQPDPAPSTPLERALAAVLDDPSARPALWKALWFGSIFLPVADANFDDDDHAVFRFVTLDIGGEPTIIGFTTEERLDLVTPDEPVGRVEPIGEELAALWPDGHWLMLNPGFTLSTVLSPAEIRGLPDGPMVVVPEEAAVRIEAPPPDDDRVEALAGVCRRVPGVKGLHWAVLRPDPPGHPRDVLVVAADPAMPRPAVLAGFTEAASRAGFGAAIVLPAQDGVAAGLAAEAATKGRHVI
jgi:hypothetical protein